MTKPNPLFHSERPWEVLRDTIIVNRPFNDPTEFQVIAWVDASECGREAAKDNARFIVEAVNNYVDDNHPGKYLDPSIGGELPTPVLKIPNTIVVNKHHYEQMETLIKQLDNILQDDGASNNNKVTRCVIRMFRYQNGKDL
jgi:hypothetical protein